MLLGKDEARKAIDILFREYEDAHYYLNFSTPLELLVAAILSAQTRDQVVNSITPSLFKRFRSAEDYANSTKGELLKYIKSVTFAERKAEQIIKACRIILEKHKGKVPDNMNDLLELPGIGRKTANTILINAFGKVEGIPVDTWVIKLSYRIGLSDKKDPEEIEKDLMNLLDKKYWEKVAYVLKAHGHKVCQSLMPICSKCVINSICPKNGVKKSK
ncbi:MAG: endonuclease III [Candidatus Micrarchaeaceae archaeon]